MSTLPRKAIPKKVRFEVFKRDFFTCRYCGKKPPEVALEIDHIYPHSKEGGSEEINLITACSACNSGKGAIPLDQCQPRPDADLKYLEAQQEVVELKRYLEEKEALDSLHASAIPLLEIIWREHIKRVWYPKPVVFKGWLKNYSPALIELAIQKAECADRRNGFKGTKDAVAYVGTVLRNEKAKGPLSV